MNDNQASARHAFASELFWLNASHRALREVAVTVRARLIAGEAVGISISTQPIRERLAVLDVPFAGPSNSRRSDRGDDMIEATPTASRSAAAERMRNSRIRQRDGIRVVPFEIRDAEIENLIRVNVLNPEARNDKLAIARALGTLLDRIPVSWWQAALHLRGRS